MDILKLIENDHREVKGIITKLQHSISNQSSGGKELARKLFVELLLHAKTEQIALYSEIAKIGEQFKDFAVEGKIEHKLIEVTLRKLVKHAESDDDFKACVNVVKDLIEHHAEEEEEDELFPKLREAIDLPQRVQMGENMAKLKEKFRGDVEKLVADAMRGMSLGEDHGRTSASAH